MNGLIISKPNKDATKAEKKHQTFNSESNQWKIHRRFTSNFTANNQTNTLAHGLGYTPAFISFEKQSANSYFNWAPVNDYVDGEKISMLGNNGDIRSVILFKDFGR